MSKENQNAANNNLANESLAESPEFVNGETISNVPDSNARDIEVEVEEVVSNSTEKEFLNKEIFSQTVPVGQFPGDTVEFKGQVIADAINELLKTKVIFIESVKDKGEVTTKVFLKM